MWQPYKEMLCVVMLAIVLYLNKFLLFPKLYLKREYLWYWSITVFLLFMIGFSEIQLVKSNIIKIMSNSLTPKQLSWYLVSVFFLVTFRYAGFFAFFFINKVTDQIKLLLEQQQKLLAVENKQIIITTTSGKEVLLTLKEITYISVEGKLSVVHLINKQEYRQIQTLNYYEKIIPEHLCLRVNRNNLVMYHYVCDYNADSVTLRINNNGEQQIFPFFHNQNQNIFEKLKKNVTSEIEKNEKRSKKVKKRFKFRTKKNETFELKEISKQILEIIRNNPSIFAKDIKSQLPQVTPRTIDNHLRKLKDLGLVKREGAPKTGGYFLV